MTRFGEHWAGVCLGGEYTLGRLLGLEDETGGSGAFFEASSPSRGTVLLKLESGEDPDVRLALWKRSVYLQHPHLLQLLDCGREDDAPERSCLYAAFEWPDDRLTSALADRPLMESEARDLLTAALDALRYLHAQGLVHGAVDANHILAVGDSIKLSTDGLREPEENSAYADDIAALGALLYRVLTGRDFEGQTAGVPEPFAAIIRNTTAAAPADRWRIPEILAALGPAPAPVEPEPVEPPPAVEPAPVEAVPVAAAALVEPPPPPEPERGIATRPLRPAPPRLPFWAWPASLAAVVGCILWVLHTPAPKPVAPAPVPAQPQVQPSAPHSAAPPAIPRSTPAPPPTESAERAAAPTGERPVWRVIAYTYNALRDAERKALAINKRWPGFNAEVFAPKGGRKPPYLVALGGRMNRMEAARLLQRARSRGLPRDTFILNFSD